MRPTAKRVVLELLSAAPRPHEAPAAALVAAGALLGVGESSIRVTLARLVADGTVDLGGRGVYRLVAHYGFMQSPDVPAALEAARARGLTIREDTTYYLAHLTLFANDRIGMAAWRDKLFIVLARNARRATNFFRIPADCVVEIGIQLEL